MDELTPFFILMGAVFAGLIVFAYVVKLLEVRKARNWKTAPGRIIQSRTRQHTRRDVNGKSIREVLPDVVYEYEVGGRRYRGTRISFAERITGADLEAALERYPVGADVTVSYNPGKPAEAVLERWMPAAVGKSVGLLSVFFILAALMVPLALGGIGDWLAPRLPNPERAPFTALAAGIGLLTLLLALAMQREAWAARDWPSVPGEILSAESEAYLDWTTSGGRDVMRTFFRPVIVYIYTVNRQEYTSDRVSFGGQAGWSSSRFFRRTLEQYPPGRLVTVYFNPRNPSEAVLERRVWGLWLLVGVGLLLLGLAAAAGSGMI